MKTKALNPVEQIYAKGLQHEIAEACQISRQAIDQWAKVPWNRVLIVEKITGMSRHQIRPDIYPRTKRTP